MQKKKCPECGYLITVNNFNKHVGSKACIKNKNKKYREMDKCPYCGISLNEMFGNNNSKRANHIRWCKMNPKREQYIEHLKNRVKENNPMYGREPWNKGLTKESDERLKKISETLSSKYKEGELSPSFLGKKHSNETIEKLRKKALDNDYQRVCKNTITYKTKDGKYVKLDSKWELKVAKELDANDVKWERPSPIIYVDDEGRCHNYFPDFYLVDFDVYLDPKNKWVQEVQKEKINYLNEQYKNIIILNGNELTFEKIIEIVKEFKK